MNTCACVYAIVCPITKKVMYIGQTHAPTMRFQAHMYSTKTSVGFWFQELMACGHDPILKKLKIFKYPKKENGAFDFTKMTKVLREVESEMILKYSKKGQAIFNKQGNPNYNRDVVCNYLDNLPLIIKPKTLSNPLTGGG